ncbi:MAG: hypothetical protein GY694_17500 [Gammaproteobacteria bacterium]|nr:hypothetical protein [Gammaproteobacteria bacterium]
MNNKLIKYFIIIGLIALASSSLCFAEAHSDKILTQPELSQCNEREHQLEQTAGHLKEHTKQLQKMKNKISQLESKRNQKYSGIDLHNKISVDGYNTVNSELNQLSQHYTVEVRKLNQAVRQYKADTKQLKSDCDNKHYILQ